MIFLKPEAPNLVEAFSLVLNLMLALRLRIIPVARVQSRKYGALVTIEVNDSLTRVSKHHGKTFSENFPRNVYVTD